MRKELNTSNSVFREIIQYNGMYVDKTKFYYDLIKKNKGQYFLSRPRRFGKTLTISTLESIFKGEKELFKGLYIYDKEYNWKKHPIIRLAFNAMTSTTVEGLEERIMLTLDRIAGKNEIVLNTKTAQSKFDELIFELKEKYNSQVVILIDEYDKPILDNILETENVLKIRTFLKGFYGIIKSLEDNIRFAFLTGVSKFTQVSVFSDLNNLVDITIDSKFAEICGFTQQEVEHYFKEWIDENYQTLGITKEQYLEKLKITYDGIRFSEKPSTLYNPVSLTRAMENCNFKHYWFETGTPSFLLKLLQKNDYNIVDFENLRITSDVFSSYEIDNLKVEALLFQTGYLTIKDYDPESDLYTLSYPNKEVKQSFLKYLFDYFTFVDKARQPLLTEELRSALINKDLDEAFEILNIFYAKIDNSIKIKKEKYYQTVFYLLFMMLSFRIEVEVNTNKGRMDSVIKTEDRIYIFEFKIKKTAKEALAQIKKRDYFQKYKREKKELVLIGVSFNTKTGEIKEKKIEILKNS